MYNNDSDEHLVKALSARENGMFGTKKMTVDSFIDREASIDGDMMFSGGIRIDGRVKGDVLGKGERSLLIVGPNGVIEGRVRATDIVVEGQVIGPVLGMESVVIRQKGKVVGPINYGRIQMEDGSTVVGQLKPIDANEPADGPAIALPDGAAA